MKRAILLAAGALSVAAIAIPTLASAQFPPPPPATYYGLVPAGVQNAATVIAVVVDGQSSAVCGDGIVVPDPEDGNKLKYAVDVAQDAQILGCGRAGRTVQFFFTGNSIGGGRLATDQATWNGPGGAVKDLTTLGPVLTPRTYSPHVAKDGVN